jgi:MFS transporter, UMF1 family
MTALPMGPGPEPGERVFLHPAGPLGRFSWALFDWAAQPFFTLVTTFLFAPYFVAGFVGDPVRGQTLWGYGQAAAGLAIAVLAPVLGAIADRSGGRKPWIAVFSVCAVLGCWPLWYADPTNGATVLAILAALALAQIGVEFATVFTNAMLPGIALPGRLGRLGGFGWAFGYVGGLISLVIILGGFAVNPETGLTLLGLEPVAFAGIAEAGARLTGPFSAVWYVLFVLPLFLFTPDLAPKGLGTARAVREGLASIGATVRSLTPRSNVARFLLARMIYQDGLTALFAFGGIYAAGVFGWTTTTLGIFGILLSVFAAVGALAGGPLDDRFGSRAVCMASVAGLALAGLAALSVDRTHVLFVIEVAWAEDATGLFARPAEQAYLACAIAIGVFAGPAQAASRTLLARISPEHRMTEYFGLYALSGKATAFLAPLMISLATAASGGQRAGLLVVVVFLTAGLLLLLPVRERREG